MSNVTLVPKKAIFVQRVLEDIRLLPIETLQSRLTALAKRVNGSKSENFDYLWIDLRLKSGFLASPDQLFSPTQYVSLGNFLGELVSGLIYLEPQGGWKPGQLLSRLRSTFTTEHLRKYGTTVSRITGQVGFEPKLSAYLILVMEEIIMALVLHCEDALLVLEDHKITS